MAVLKLLLDYGLKAEDIIQAIEKMTDSDVEVTTNLGCRGDTSDDTLMDVAEREKRIFVTKNYKDFHERNYKPCEHGGVIVFHKNELFATYIANRIAALIRSGYRPKVKHHVTHLFQTHMKIVTHNEKIEVNFNEDKKLRQLINRN